MADVEQAILEPSLDIAFSAAANLDDRVLFPALARLREAAPAFWSDHQQGWLLTSHEAVAMAFNDRRFSAVRLHVAQFSAVPEEERATVIPNLMRYVSQWIINVDGAAHGRLRRLVARAFGRGIVETLRPAIQGYIDTLLDAMALTREFDFIEAAAFPLPAMVIAGLFGLPEDRLPELRTWASTLTMALASQSPSAAVLEAAERSLAEMNAVIRQEIRARRIEPRADLLSELVSARDENDALSEEELLGISHVLLIAGHDTTANSLGLGMAALLANPAQRDSYLARSGTDSLACMQELMRYVATSATQIRVVREDVDIGGSAIPAGSIAYLMIAAANRDPTVFEAPEMLDFDRDVSRSLTFGPGFHHCVGHLLARVELDMFFRAFFTRFRRVDVLGSAPCFTPNYVFRGYERFMMRVED